MNATYDGTFHCFLLLFWKAAFHLPTSIRKCVGVPYRYILGRLATLKGVRTAATHGILGERAGRNSGGMAVAAESGEEAAHGFERIQEMECEDAYGQVDRSLNDQAFLPDGSRQCAQPD
jgi:hypothetical protein